MPEIEPERVGNKVKDEVSELKTAVKALIQAVKDIEEHTGEVFMPHGTYLGIKFDE